MRYRYAFVRPGMVYEERVLIGCLLEHQEGLHVFLTPTQELRTRQQTALATTLQECLLKQATLEKPHISAGPHLHLGPIRNTPRDLQGDRLTTYIRSTLDDLLL